MKFNNKNELYEKYYLQFDDWSFGRKGKAFAGPFSRAWFRCIGVDVGYVLRDIVDRQSSSSQPEALLPMFPQMEKVGAAEKIEESNIMLICCKFVTTRYEMQIQKHTKSIFVCFCIP